MTGSPTLALLFDFDGTLYVGDLPILAYARHAADLLPDAAATDLIDGVRYLLEGRSVTVRTIDLRDAEDGYMGVEMLARAAGLTAEHLDGAYRLARQDLARSAFALDAPQGLPELLADLADAYVLVVTNADLTGVAEVLTAVEVAGHIDEIVAEADKPHRMPEHVAALLDRIDAAATPERLMVVGDRWTADLADAFAAGARTALVDRFHRGDGTPHLRGASLAELIPGIRDWARSLGGLE
ncbi:FMN phosphatase YigB, HAD superfamily [Nakamurella panacisegetis]|uniref:FMN phosphatase YigB, HAD superfamily n=1 Tax=Nakamurella panacisegetis TaxID=1090615 RepID=A0A1H0QZ90_9ACTN|nr:HAD family hydrolase [Nakamurella panacisegetis]SDP22239.1 FMN phosphatase YigB, HAD superfamily [Nakamurella panacisegetis]